MKKTLITLLAALVFTMGMSAATNDKKEKRDKRGDRKEMMAKAATRMAERLKLDDATQTWFVPLYTEYRDTLQAIQRPQRPAQKDGEKAEKKELTDLDALQMVENTFQKAEQTTALKREYFAKFKEKLTPKQLVEIFCREDRPQGMQRQGQMNGNRQGMNGNGGFPGGPGGGFPGGFGGGF